MSERVVEPEAAECRRRGAQSCLVSWGNAALGFLYPESCQLCHQARATPGQGFVCDRCQSEVRWITSPYCDRCGLPIPGEVSGRFECTNCREQDFAFVRARSAVIAREGVVLEAIHLYKYKRALFLEPFLAKLLTTKAVPELQAEHWDLIVPVPLHPTKRREREFNQAERLARRLSAATHILLANALRRVLPTPTQTRLSREERLKNVRGAFAARGRGEVKGARVVVLDDVFTTGATTNACAETLLRAGASEVCVWTVARGV